MKEVCEDCGSTENLQAHHISYNPEIIQTLCVNCHLLLHKHGVGTARGIVSEKRTSGSDMSYIRVSPQLKDVLTRLAKKGERYEDIIWKLVNIAKNDFTAISIEDFTFLQTIMPFVMKELEES